MMGKDFEREDMEKVLHGAIDRLIEGCEKLDMDMAFDVFLDSEDFLMMGTDGSLCSYEKYLNDNFQYLGGCETFDLTTYKREIRILDEQTAVYAWAYGVKAKQKTGERDIIENAGASFLFRKIRDSWKVVYYHESSVPLKRIASL